MMRCGITLRLKFLYVMMNYTFLKKASAHQREFPLYKIAQPSSGLGTDVRIAYNNFARGGKSLKYQERIKSPF